MAPKFRKVRKPRNSKTGQWDTMEHAKKRPATTEVETVWMPVKKRRRRK